MLILSIFNVLFIILLVRVLLKVDVNPLKPNVLSITVYRDYALLTVFSISYWLCDENYLEHYIISSVGSEVIYLSYIACFIFMFLFVIYLAFFIPMFVAVSQKMPKENEQGFILLLKVYSWILFILLLLNFISSPPVIFSLGSVGAVEISELRFEGSSSALFKNIRNYWIPMLSYTWLYIYWVSESECKKNNLKAYLVLCISMALVSSVWVMAKSQLASYIFGMIGVYIVATERKLSLKKVVITFALIIFIVFLAYFVTLLDTDKANLSYVTTLVIHRVFTQSAGVIYSFYIYPDFFEFKGFNGVSSFLASLDGEVFSSVYADLIDHAVPEFSDISGALSSFVAGDAWGLFGWYGVFIGPLFISFFYGMIYVFSTHNKSRVKVIFIGMYGVYFGNAFVASSFYSFLWPVGILISIFPILFLYLCSGALSEKSDNIRIR